MGTVAEQPDRVELAIEGMSCASCAARIAGPRDRTRARDGHPETCVNCAPRRAGRCGVCGRVTRIAVKATADSPAVGVCCYRLPVAVCVDYGRERPCFHASGPEPLCERCWALRRAPVCLDCGQRRLASRRVDGGVPCGPCDMKRGGTTAACQGCRAVVSLIRGLCDGCRLGERLAELAAGFERERRPSSRRSFAT